MQLFSLWYSNQQITLIFVVISPTQIHYTVPCCEQQECDPSASGGQETSVMWGQMAVPLFCFVLFHFAWFGFLCFIYQETSWFIAIIQFSKYLVFFAWCKQSRTRALRTLLILTLHLYENWAYSTCENTKLINYDHCHWNYHHMNSQCQNLFYYVSLSF